MTPLFGLCLVGIGRGTENPARIVRSCMYVCLSLHDNLHIRRLVKVVCSRDQRGPRRGNLLRWLLLRQLYLGCSMKIFMAARAGDTVVLSSLLD